MTAESTQRRLLIVEDDPDTIELLDEQLEDLDFEITVARDGEEAILRTGAGRPDLVLMDVMMPGLNGFETTRYFKAHFTAGFVPVMILSAKGDAEAIAEGIAMGADDYTVKPYDASELRGRISRLLALRDAETALAADDDTGTRTGVVDQRLRMAHDFCERGLYALARNYLTRATELAPDHGPSLDLLAQIAARD